MTDNTDIVGQGDARNRRSLILTEMQYRVLELCKAMTRFAILGSAGCGKTFVALEQARRRSAAGDRVLILCYNRGIAEYLKRQVENFAPNEQASMVTTFQSLPFKLGVHIEIHDNREFWETDIPNILLAHLTSTNEIEKFDTIIIDEAQDFLPIWWDVVLALLKHRETGRIYAFGDQRQGIFQSSMSIPLELANLHLDQNVRNSLPIAELASHFISDPIHLIGLDGPRVIYRECPENEAIEMADKYVVELSQTGWGTGDVAVLTTGSRHKIHKDLVEGANRVEYWEGYFESDTVFYSTVFGFKGLERRVVILTLNGWKENANKKEIFYTGVTRARDLLIICGSSEDLRMVAGKVAWKKLSSSDSNDEH